MPPEGRAESAWRDRILASVECRLSNISASPPQQLDPGVSETTPKSTGSFVADSLATGMLIMLAMTVVQRAVGFVRGIWFCRLLDDSSLGQWSMAYDFVVMVTPIMLLGLPGSLPRYVEHYRGRGHLPSLVRRLLIATAVLAISFVVVVFARPTWFGWLVFSDADNVSLVRRVAVCVLGIVAFNFVNQLMSALRQVRVVSQMQFAQSIAFTVLGVGLLASGGSVTGLIDAFLLATLIAMVPGLLVLRAGWQGLPQSDDDFDSRSMWRRLLPYAAALWAMNVLINVFFLSDRYMILHLLPAEGAGGVVVSGQAAIGQYHSSRIIPGLLMSVATMVGGVLMPYMTADWEAGRRQRVRDRLQQILFGVSALFTFGAALSLWIAPWLFAVCLEGRYGEGLGLMPMAFVIAIWFALATIGQEYLWVAERGKLVAVAIGAALLVNIALNYLLLPRWGLHGAVTATMVANAVMLLGIWGAMARHKFPLDGNTIFLTLLPATLLAGPAIATASVLITGIASVSVRQWCRDGVRHLQQRRRVTATV